MIRKLSGGTPPPHSLFTHPSSGEKDATTHSRHCSGNVPADFWLASRALLLVWREESIIRWMEAPVQCCWSQSDSFQLHGTVSPILLWKKELVVKWKQYICRWWFYEKLPPDSQHRVTIIWQLSIVLATPVRHRTCAESTDSLFTNTQDCTFPPAKKEAGVPGLGSLTLFISPLYLPGPFQAHIFWVPGLCTSFILL